MNIDNNQLMRGWYVVRVLADGSVQPVDGKTCVRRSEANFERDDHGEEGLEVFCWNGKTWDRDEW